MSGIQKLKMWVLVIGGNFVCAALVILFAFVARYRTAAGLGLTKADLLQGSAFVGLSLIVLLISSSAAFRSVRRADEGARFLGLAAGISIVAGLIAGLVFSRMITADMQADDESYDRRVCGDALAPPPNYGQAPAAVPDADAIVACLPHARACRLEQGEWSDERARSYLETLPAQPDTEFANASPKSDLAWCARVRVITAAASAR